MSATDRDRAQELLSEFIGDRISSVECDEFHLRLVFQDKSQFVTQSPWRLFLKADLLLGNGYGKRGSEELFEHLKGLKVNSVAIADCGDTQLLFENGYVLEAISNSVRYETWEAHIQAGWVIFNGGRSLTAFPPSAAPPKGSSKRG
jgi:hypothetical protein